MVADALEAGYEVREGDAGFAGALAFAQALDMAILEAGLEFVGPILEDTHLFEVGHIAGGEDVEGVLHELVDDVEHALDILLAFSAQLYVLQLEILQDVRDVLCVVADPLDVGVHMEISGDEVRVTERDRVLVDTREVRADLLGEPVDIMLVFVDLREAICVIAQETLNCVVQVLESHAGHALHLLLRHVDRDGRVRELAEVDVLELVRTVLLHLVLALHKHVCQLDDLVHERVEHDDLEHLEQEVCEGNASAEGAGVVTGTGDHPDDRLDLRCEEQQQDKHQYGSEDIEQKVNEGAALRVLLARNRGKDRTRACANVAAQDDEHADSEVDETLCAHDDEDRDGDGRGLHDRGDDEAHQHAENRVRERGQEVDDLRNVTKCTHRRRHRGDADEEEAEAHHDFAGFFHHLVRDEVHHHGTREHEDRCDRGEAEGDEERGDGGTDVCAQDDAAGVVQRHEAGVHEGDGHDGGGAGGLDHGGEEQSDQEAGQAVAGEGFEDGTQLRAGDLLDTVAHHVHTCDKQAEASQKTH